MKSSDMRSAFHVLDELAGLPDITRGWVQDEIEKLALEQLEREQLLAFFDDARARHARRVLAEIPSVVPDGWTPEGWAIVERSIAAATREEDGELVVDVDRFNGTDR